MGFELGVYSTGNTPRLPDGSLGRTSDAIRNIMEAIVLAEQVGLDFFGVGEHHRAETPISSPVSILNAAAAVTKRIRLGSAVTVLSTDDPIRIYQQHATAAAISDGRVEIIAGRGSSIDSFPLFGYRIEEYDSLYAEKLELLLLLNANERVTWSGAYRSIPLVDATVVPRADRPLKIWLGTGGNPGSSLRAGESGLPVAYEILGGNSRSWARAAAIYREAGIRAGKGESELQVSAASHGFLDSDGRTAKDTFYRYERTAMEVAAKQRGFAVPDRAYFEANSAPGGMAFAGDPVEIADRLIELQSTLGHTRHILQMDIGGIPHAQFMKSIELLGTIVAPRVRAAIG
ncbi:MAG TPA: LLM class flavin-dependent oxidoreductase [Spirochaetia bacterium]|nr:LLM class flavin-dependent oxidoreductase [Spirochaetia bacterium]